jgi:hypothetical protein
MVPHSTDDMPAIEPPQIIGKKLPTVEPMPKPIQTNVFVDMMQLLYTTTMKKETKIILIFLALVLIILIVQLWRQYTFIQRAQTMQVLRGHISQEVQQLTALRQRGPLTAADVSYIQAWMTFDYINTAFNIPPSYLSNYLTENLHLVNGSAGSGSDISDIYPHLSISHYARENATSSAALTTVVADAVRSYLIASSMPTASSTNELHP